MRKSLFIYTFALSLNAQSITSDQINKLTFRNIGPAVAGGRIHDVEIVPDKPEIVFIASAHAGIW